LAGIAAGALACRGTSTAVALSLQHSILAHYYYITGAALSAARVLKATTITATTINSRGDTLKFSLVSKKLRHRVHTKERRGVRGETDGGVSGKETVQLVNC
jgi:hypothetical protein